jgi:hypothetical protein
MAGVPVPAYQQFWMDKRSSLENKSQSIMDKCPDGAPAMKLLFKLVCDIEGLSRFTPAPVGQSGEWTATVSSAEESCKEYCKSLRGKAMFGALYGTYTVTLNDPKAVLKANIRQESKKGGRLSKSAEPKGHTTEEVARTLKKAALPTTSVAQKNEAATLQQ